VLVGLFCSSIGLFCSLIGLFGLWLFLSQRPRTGLERDSESYTRVQRDIKRPRYTCKNNTIERVTPRPGIEVKTDIKRPGLEVEETLRDLD